jgi:hypothetical protein
MTSVTKTKLVLSLSGLLLASCSGSNYASQANNNSFVALADVDSVAISSLSFRVKTGAFDVGGATSSAEARAVRQVENAASTNLTAHEIKFYSNNDFSYSQGGTNATGHHDATSGLYYLIGNASSGYVYDSLPATFTSFRNKAISLLNDDYAYIVSLYEQVKDYSTKQASDFGFTTLSVLVSNIDSTVGYTVHITIDSSATLLERDLYLTLDKLSSGSYAFTDVIIREKTTYKDSGSISYSTNEFGLTVSSSLSDMVFNLNSYLLSKGDTDISTIDSSSLVSTL